MHSIISWCNATATTNQQSASTDPTLITSQRRIFLTIN